MKVDFRRLNWENYPSTETPINADNLNRLEEGVAGLYSDMAGIEEGIDETSTQVSAMQTSVTSMETRVTSMENGLPTMVGNQIDTKFGQDIGDNVTSWLTEHVTPSGSAVVVDDTLSIEGAAADAKKTGDEISSVKQDLTMYSETSTTSTHAYSEGSFLLLNGALYRATSSIAIGDTLTEGTNIEATTVGTEIEEVYTGRPEAVSTTVNKLNPNEIVSNTMIQRNGTLNEDDGTKTTGKIDVVSGKSGVAFSGLNSQGTARVCLAISRIVYFNSSDAVISYEDSVASNSIGTIPSGTSYLRLSARVDFFNERSPMVEFVDTTSEISDSYVDYSVVTSYTHGIEYLDEKQQNIDGRLTTVEGSISGLSGLTAQVAENTAKLDDITGESIGIDNLATFEHGYVTSSGSFNSSYTYRCGTPTTITLTKDITITIADGYRIYLFIHDADGNKVSAAWYTGSVAVEMGTIFRMTIARVTEDTSETVDIEAFCRQVTYVIKESVDYIAETLRNVDAQTSYGLTWDWWINSNCIDTYGNAYIGYIDTEGYHGIMKRQPDGVMQYKRLESAENDDDHNGTATIVLDDGRILAIGAYGHSKNNHVVCWRSTEPYSIDEMERFSFNITENEWAYACTYSQIFQYNGTLFDFMRCVATKSGETTGTAWICLVSSDDGETWTAYDAIKSNDPYVTLEYTADDAKFLKGVVGKNPSSGVDTLKGFTFDMSTQKFYDLSGTEIGSLVALTGTVDEANVAHGDDMTSIISQGSSNNKARLFTVAKTNKASTVFLYAVAVDSDMSDFTYYRVTDGTALAIGSSGTPFGNNHYISGACFGADTDTIYYAKATTDDADGNHELHKVKISNGVVDSDDIIAEASICILRPLFLGQGEIATSIGHYNDQNSDYSYNGSFTAWELKPMFTSTGGGSTLSSAVGVSF